MISWNKYKLHFSSYNNNYYFSLTSELSEANEKLVNVRDLQCQLTAEQQRTGHLERQLSHLQHQLQTREITIQHITDQVRFIPLHSSNFTSYAMNIYYFLE